MRAYLIIIFEIRQKDMTEVPLSEHDNVVKAFPSDRTDSPFSISVLPRGARRRRSIADAHRSESAHKNLPIGAVPVTNEIAGGLFPPAGFRYLICPGLGDRWNKRSASCLIMKNSEDPLCAGG